jgi:predicted Zn-dependent protease
MSYKIRFWHYVFRLSLFFIASTALAGEISSRNYPLPDHGSIEFQVPSNWEDSLSQPPNRLPPTIEFKQKAGHPFIMLITPMWPAKENITLPDGDNLRKSVQEAADRVASSAVEKNINIVELNGPSAHGYYFSLTDRAPKPGEYKYLTQGHVRVGDLMVIFTILTNDGQDNVISDGLALMKSAKQTKEPIVASKQDLEKDVLKPIRENDDTGIRRASDKVFQLAQLYEAEGDNAQALKVYEAGLRADANNLDNHLRYAKLLSKMNKKQEAVSAMRIVYDMAELEPLIEEAENFLRKAGVNIQGAARHLPDNAIKIAILPLGNPNPRIVSAVSELLEKKMGLSFPILEREDIGTSDWDRSREFVRNYIDWMKSRISSQQFEQMKDDLGYKNNSLDSYEDRKQFIYSFFNKLGTKGEEMKKEFDEMILKMSSEGVYDIHHIANKMKKDHPLMAHDPKIQGYLAITDKNICEGEGNWRFGGAYTGYGVVSYSRFTAEFTKEPQNRTRLITRTFKQAMSGANFILGIARCNNPNCVRAYPHSLDELDKKPVDLCPLCQDALDQHKSKLK